MKSFFKTCLITAILFTCILTPTIAWWQNIQDNTIFSKSEVTLEEEMPVMVDSDSPFFRAFTEANRINVLLVGTNKGLADTIMLASYNMDNDNIDIISIPRDTYYPRKGYNGPSEKKMNAAYAEGGILGLATAVSDLLQGIPINFYMRIDYDGVANIVDSMGGVPMDVPFHMYYNDEWDTPPLHIDIEEGYQVLDGETAVKFLRFRKGDKGHAGYKEGDIERIQTQQKFMKAAFKQALSLNIVKVTKCVLNNVESDVNVKTVVQVAKNASGLSADKVTTYTVPGVADYGEGDLSFWFTNEKKIKEMLTEIYSEEISNSAVPGNSNADDDSDDSDDSDDEEDVE